MPSARRETDRRLQLRGWPQSMKLLLAGALGLQIGDGSLEQAHRVGHVVDSMAAILLYEEVVVSGLQLRLRPGGIDGKRSFRLAHRRQHQRKLVEQVLHFGLRAVDDAIAIIIHQWEVERGDLRAMAGLARSRHLLGGNGRVAGEAHLKGMAAHQT